MWPSMRELKVAMKDGPGFVIRLMKRTKPKDRYPGSPKHEEVMLSGPLDQDLFDRLHACAVEVFTEQMKREKPAGTQGEGG